MSTRGPKPLHEPPTVSLASEYSYLLYYEVELFKTRWQVFTALLSISFVITGLGLQKLAEHSAQGSEVLLKLVCTVGVLVYFVGYFHYLWFHSKAHGLRHRLKEIEDKLEYRIYRVREQKRPAVFGLELHFSWVLVVLTLANTILIAYVWIVV